MKQSLKKFIVPYSLLFIGTLLLSLSSFIVNGKSLVWNADGLSQHYPALIYLGEWLREVIGNFFEGNPSIPLFDFNLNYGADVISTLHYYSFGDPLDLLSVFVPAQYTEYLYIALIVLRLYLSGLFFALYCFYQGKDGKRVIAGALVYCFSSLAIMFGVLRHPFWLNAYLYLPLLFIGAEKLFKRQSPLLYIVMIFISCASSFYFFYMLAIAILLYAIFRFATCYRGGLKALAKYVGIFLGCTLIGVCMAAVIFIPEVSLMLGSNRAQSSLHEFNLFYPIAEYPIIFMSFLAYEAGTSTTCLGYPPLALICVLLLFGRKHKSTSLKVAFCVLVVFILFPFFGSVFNGFSYAVNRWVWLFAFLVAFIVIEVWPDLLNPTKHQKRVYIWGGIIYAALAFTFSLVAAQFQDAQAYTFGKTAGPLGVLVITLIAVYFIPKLKEKFPADRSKKIATWGLIGLICLGVIVNGHCHTDSKGSNLLNEYPNIGEAYAATVGDTPLNAVKELEQESEDFSRYDLKEPISPDLSRARNDNAASLLGLSGASSYWSLNDKNITAYLLENGIPLENFQRLVGLDGRSYLQALAGVKYYVTSSTDTNIPYGLAKVRDVPQTGLFKDAVIYEKQGTLPFGYTYTDYTTESQLEAAPTERRQEIMMQSVVLEDADAQNLSEEIANDQGVTDQENIPYQLELGQNIVELGDNTYMVKAGEKMTLRFEGLSQCENYLVVGDLNATSNSDYAFYHDDVEEIYSKEEYDALSAKEKLALLINEWGRGYNYYNGNYRLSIKVTSDGISKTIPYMNAYHKYSTGQTDFVINLGYSETPRTSIELTFNRTGIYNFDALDVICQKVDKLDSYIQQRTEETLQNVEFKDNYISGTIDATRNEILVLNVPYNGGWSATVDGQPVDLMRANGMFSAVAISPGTHLVELHYSMPGLKVGLILTAVGFVGFFAVLAVTFIRKRQTKRVDSNAK